MSKRKRVILLIVAGVLVLAVFMILLFEFVLFPGRRSVALPPLPGLASSAAECDPELLAPGIRKIMKNRLSTSVIVYGEQVDDLLASSYETSERRGFPGTKTTSILAGDQIRYGRVLVKMNERSAFFDWADDFDRAFRPKGSGFHATALRSTEQNASSSNEAEITESNVDRGRDDLPVEYEPVNVHWSVTLSYARALLEGYQKFGGRRLENRIRAEADRLLPLFRDGKTDDELLAGPRMLLALDEWDNPLPGSTPEPGQEAPVEHSPGTYLADVDLWALSAFARFDPAWASIANEWREIVENAVLESSLPLYASAYRSDTSSYLAVTGGGVMSSLREQLEIAVHLAEVGVVHRDLLSFIRSALRDDKRLPSGWNPVTGSPSGQSASSCDYALALILGRVAGDTLLIESARDVMMRQYAGSQTSDIFGGWYRSGSTSYTYRLVAEDNTAVLLALR